MTRRTTPSRKRRSRAGFTLLELMVALVAGLTAITSIYFVGAASSRHFHEQQRIAQTQMSLRMAMEQLRRDIQRAGYLGTPNSQRETGCLTPPNQVQAVNYVRLGTGGLLPNQAENGAGADTLILTGNYATGDSYFSAGVSANGGTIFLQQNWQNFRRDFGIPPDVGNPNLVDPDRFDAAFSPSRYLHVTTQNGNHFFAPITGADPAAPSVTIGTPLPTGGFCLGGLGVGAIVAPLSQVRYSVQDLLAGTAFAADPETAAARGLVGPQLVREELDFAGNAIAGTQRIVLEYVASISYSFVFDTQLTPGMPPTLVEATDAAAEAIFAARPEQVRSVIVTLAARTPEIDPRFAWVAEAAGNLANGVPPTRYRPNSDLPGAARVRSMRTEIFLTNVAARGMR